jgi:hypothetical protein
MPPTTRRPVSATPGLRRRYAPAVSHYIVIRRFPDGHEETNDFTADSTDVNLGQTFDDEHGTWRITEPPRDVEGTPLPVIVVHLKSADDMA